MTVRPKNHKKGNSGLDYSQIQLIFIFLLFFFFCRRPHVRRPPIHSGERAALNNTNPTMTEELKKEEVPSRTHLLQ